MPKADSSKNIARMDTQPLTIPEPTISHTSTSSRRSSSGARKGRHRSHRKGRPPGSGLRVRIKQHDVLAALDQVLADHENAHSEHTNHSLLANHPSSARHDYSADDENKPREERSYTEFYPFLDISLKLDIVDISPAQSKAVENDSQAEATAANPVIGAAEVPSETVEAERPDVEMTNVSNTDDGVTNNQDVSAPKNEDQDHDSTDSTANGPSEEDHPNGVVTTSKEKNEEEEEESQTNPPNQDTAPESNASDPDVFSHTAENELASGQKEITPQEMSDDENGEASDMSNQVVTGSEPGPADEPSEVMDVDLDLSAQKESPAEVEDSPMMASDAKEGGESSGAAPLQDVEMKPSSSRATDEPKPAEKLSISITIKEPLNRPSSTTVLEPKTPMALLPKSSFRLIPREDDSLEEFQLPLGHNVRYIEPTETELAERVEYDMDEQDEYWLKEINVERRKQDLGEVTPELFEKIIDRLEKEWFDL
ncbi:nuA3 HAT complex component nto1, partial [Mortierella sp. NVP85]